IIVSERCSGVDNSETIYFYMNLALFEHRAGNTIGALYIISQAMKLWTFIVGSGHPDTLTTFINVATMLQSIKDHKLSVTWILASIDMASKFYGEDSIQVGSLYYQISQPYIFLQDYNEAVNVVRKAH